jgi:hypothetical protein
VTTSGLGATITRLSAWRHIRRAAQQRLMESLSFKMENL